MAPIYRRLDKDKTDAQNQTKIKRLLSTRVVNFEKYISTELAPNFPELSSQICENIFMVSSAECVSKKLS